MSYMKLYYMEHSQLQQLLLSGDYLSEDLLPYYKERAEKSMHEQASLSFLASAVLLRQVLGVTRQEQIRYTDLRKPFLVDGSAYISLSHDHDYTILSVSDLQHGCDIERVTSPKMRVAERSFPSIYYNELLSAPSSEKFTELWTKTEAVLKAEGTGFTASLKEHPDWVSKWTVKSFPFRNYWISIAASEDFSLLSYVNAL